MARIYPLFSSSKGNSYFVGNNNGGILVDAGVSCKRICDALQNNEIDISAVQGIFITHTHSDHIKGLKVFTKKYNVPLFAQQTNIEILEDTEKIAPTCKTRAVDNTEICVGDFSVKSFETQHDTPASCGYRITCPDGKVVVTCTDLGYVSDTVKEHLNKADLVLLESNYDEAMLRNGSYPYELKKRISSDHGHLSNSDCGNELNRLIQNGTNKFILGHLSQENNRPETAEKSAVNFLSEYERNSDYLLHIAKPDGCGMVVTF